MAVAWILFYADGSTFSSEDGPPENAPREGAIVCAEHDIGVGRLLWHSGLINGVTLNYFCWFPPGVIPNAGKWVPQDFLGLHWYLRQPGKEKIVVQGTAAIPYSDFQKVYQQALDDPRLPVKVANDPREYPSPLPESPQ